MKSIVIFGGAGFVGKHLIRRLTKNGHKIIVPYQRSVQEAKIRLLGVTGQVIPFRYSSLDDKRLKSVLEIDFPNNSPQRSLYPCLSV